MEKIRRGCPSHVLSETSVMVMAALCMSSASAQALRADTSVTPGAPALHEVVVTGEKVRRSVRETASSVEVVSDRALSERPEADSVQDLFSGVPNVQYSGVGNAPVIRGLDGQGSNSGAGAFFGGTVPRARINVDGHNLGFWETSFGASSIWDVNAVEIFRGPQTSALGANSIAGSVIINTKDPTFTPEREARLQVGNRSSRRASAVLSGPLMDEELAARLAVDYSSRNTFVSYTNPAYSAGNTDLDPKAITGRLKFLWTPQAVPGLESKLTFSYLRTNMPTSESASAPYDELQNRTLTMPSFNTHGWTGIHDISYDIGNGVEVSNQFQYTSSKTERVSEPMSNGGGHMDYRDISDEVRANFSIPDSQVSGVVGLYYSHVDSDDLLYTRGTSTFHDEKESVGAFTDMSWRFAERWTLSGGLRYQYDSVKRNGTSSLSRLPLDFDETYDEILPKLSLAYDVTDSVTTGALISRGYNPGGVGLQFANGQFYTFNPEKLWNYELFTRVKSLDDRLTLNANLFFADYKDSQVILPDYLNGVLFGNIVRNADKSRAYGLELSAEYAALDNLRLQGNVGYLHTKINRLSDANGQTLVGKEFAKAPRYSLGLNVNWNITDQLSLNLGARHSDGYHSSEENLPAYWVDSYTVANTRVEYQFDRQWQFYAFVDNLTDERKPTWLYDDRTTRAIAGNMLEPRTYGVGVHVKF